MKYNIKINHLNNGLLSIKLQSFDWVKVWWDKPINN